jgi:hypothetical protein
VDKNSAVGDLCSAKEETANISSGIAAGKCRPFTHQEALQPIPLTSSPGQYYYTTFCAVTAVLNLTIPPPTNPKTGDLEKWMNSMVHLLAAWMVTIDPRKMPLAVGIYAARKRPDTADWGKVTFCLGISKPRLRNKAHREAMGAHRETNIRTHLKPLIHLSDGHIPEYQESQDLYSLLEGLTASSDSHMSCQ